MVVVDLLREHLNHYGSEYIYNNTLLTIRRSQSGSSDDVNDCVSKGLRTDDKFVRNCPTLSSPGESGGGSSLVSGLASPDASLSSTNGNPRVFSSFSPLPPQLVEEEGGKQGKRVEVVYKKPIGFVKEEGKIKYEYFNILDFNFEYLSGYFMPLLKENVNYAFLLKLARDDGGVGMGGTHRIFNYTNSNDFYTKFYKFYTDLFELITEFKREYFDCDILYVEVMYISMNELDDLKIKSINRIDVNKEFVKTSDKKLFNNSILPLSYNTFYYGDKIYKFKDEDGELKVLVDNIDFIDLLKQSTSNSVLINKENPILHNLDFYLYTNKSKVKYVIVTKLDGDKRVSEVFSLTGNKIVLAQDTIVSKDEFIRTIRNTSVTIKKDEVISYNAEYEFPYLKPTKKNFKSVSNTNFGVLDLEAFFNPSLNKSFVYAIGFKIFNGEDNLFFLDKWSPEKSDEIILNCINAMLISKHHNFIFYIHNFGGYDAYFILRVLYEFNFKNNEEYYKLDAIYRDNQILRLNIRIKVNSKSVKISLVDSYSLLQGSLDKLCKDFECDVVKGSFPHSFVNELRLGYIGNTPDKYFYSKKGVSMSDEDYSIINKHD